MILQGLNSTYVQEDYSIYRNKQTEIEDDKFSFDQLGLLNDIFLEMKEIYEELEEEEAVKFVTTLFKSAESLEVFFKSYKEFEEQIIKPEISISLGGEISLEWYGRIGARANITFLPTKEILFISLFHQEEEASKYFSTSKISNNIIEKLQRLSSDKY